MKYRKKPIIIEAKKFDGNNREELVRWGDENSDNHPIGLDPDVRLDKILRVNTLAGMVTIITGDWILMGIAGEFYPYKPDIFEKMLKDVDQFVQDKYTPFILKSVIEKKDVLSKIKNKVDSANYKDALDYIISFSKSAMKRIKIFEKELKQPIIDQERRLLANIDASFQNMRDANATIS